MSSGPRPSQCNEVQVRAQEGAGARLHLVQKFSSIVLSPVKRRTSEGQKRQILSTRSVRERIRRSHLNLPFPGATKVGKPRAEIDKASQADPPRGVADARKEIEGQVGSGG